MKTLKTNSAEATQKLAEEMAGKLQAPSSKLHALVLALQGDLGAGKTTFTQGFFRGLGIKRRAISPTFIIMRRYRVGTRNKRQGTGNFTNLYHFDAYRLKAASDLEALEFKLILADPANIVLIEWPERVRDILPKATKWIRFKYGRKENERIITY